MHFWVSAARGGLYGHGCCPRKIGTNWFMPAVVNRRFGEAGIKLEEGTMVCCFDLKKSKKECLISLLVIMESTRGRNAQITWSAAGCRCWRRGPQRMTSRWREQEAKS